jgi:hypothetical protein
LGELGRDRACGGNDAALTKLLWSITSVVVLGTLTVFGLVSADLSRSEALVGWLGILVLCAYAGWSFLRWVSRSSARPDPWDDGVAAALASDDCTEICHHCLAPHDPLLHHCPECGALVGPCTSLMPPLYLTSIGDVFRSGTDATHRRSAFLTCGYFFVGFVGYGLVAPLFFLIPVYWFKLLRNAVCPRPSADANAAPPGDEGSSPDRPGLP